MNASLVSLALLAVVAPPPEKPLRLIETPNTRLFVRTIPDGARIILDGKEVGQSDGLFLVSPGIRKITVELDGYYSEGRPVRVRDGWITRVELALRRQPKASRPPPESPESPKPDSDRGLKAAAAYVAEADVPPPVRGAMLTVLRQHPSETRWSGRSGATMFAVAVKSLPTGEIRQRATPALLELTHMLAVYELVKAKSLLDRYAATGLTDATTLRQAVEKAAGKLDVAGNAKGVTNQTTVHGSFAVAYVIADESALTAHLFQPVELEKVQVAYRDVMHGQARELMVASNWEDALLLWRHLHEQELVSQGLYLDAARCFKELARKEDAIRVLTEAIDTFGQAGTPEFLEQAGDIAMEMETDSAQLLAEKVYQMAIDALRETISDARPPNDGG